LNWRNSSSSSGGGGSSSSSNNNNNNIYERSKCGNITIVKRVSYLTHKEKYMMARS